MRFEDHPWDNITVRLEIIIGGVGITGLSPTATVRRTSDGDYLQSDNSWDVTPDDLALTEIGNGLYSRQISSTSLATTNGNYVVLFEETTEDVLEHLLITTKVSADAQQRLVDLNQSRFRLIATDWDTVTKQPKEGTLYVYPSSAAYDADTVPDGTGAYGTYDMEALFTAGRLQWYGSSKAS